MSKGKKEEPVKKETRAERFMAARLLEAERVALEYEHTLDPRQVVSLGCTASVKDTPGKR